jgi:hypothetical protein
LNNGNWIGIWSSSSLNEKSSTFTYIYSGILPISRTSTMKKNQIQINYKNVHGSWMEIQVSYWNMRLGSSVSNIMYVTLMSKSISVVVLHTSYRNLFIHVYVLCTKIWTIIIIWMSEICRKTPNLTKLFIQKKSNITSYKYVLVLLNVPHSCISKPLQCPIHNVRPLGFFVDYTSYSKNRKMNWT